MKLIKSELKIIDNNITFVLNNGDDEFFIYYWNDRNKSGIQINITINGNEKHRLILNWDSLSNIDNDGMWYSAEGNITNVKKIDDFLYFNIGKYKEEKNIKRNTVISNAVKLYIKKYLLT